MSDVFDTVDPTPGYRYDAERGTWVEDRPAAIPEHQAIIERKGTSMDEERFALFGAVYRIELEKAVSAYPAEYVWPVAEVPEVAARMLAAVRRHTFSKDGRAFKATCKAFGIRHTYKAIYAFLGEES